MEVEGKMGMGIGEWLTGMVKEAASRRPQLSFRFARFGRSRPAADATREVADRWLLVDLM